MENEMDMKATGNEEKHKDADNLVDHEAQEAKVQGGSLVSGLPGTA